MVQAGNILQIMLAEKNGETLDEFIDRHAALFRKIANENPTWLHEFENDPDTVLDRFNAAVYSNQELH